MPSIEIRPFRRSDRDQVTALVNAHAAAVVPGSSASVNDVMSQLEREPGEYIVDPWVIERITLVAEQRERIAAATLLLRFADEERVSVDYRNAGVIRWFLFWPHAPAGSAYSSDGREAAILLIAAAIEQLERWRVSHQYAAGEIPAPGVYGLPEQWPHIREAYEAAGFDRGDHVELVYLRLVDEMPPAGDPPIAGLTAERTVGLNGTRFAALLDGEVVGYVETELIGGLRRQLTVWADIGNLHVDERFRRRGVATWLLGLAGEWLRLAGVGRLLGYALPGENNCVAILEATGFRELTRTERGWIRPVP